MIPSAYIQAWSAKAPWPDARQIEQDLIISRALCDLFSAPALKRSLFAVVRQSTSCCSSNHYAIKHGVSLALASELEWDGLMAQPDTRHDYSELRMIGYAPIGTRVFCVVFTDRDDKRRIVGLRKANAREVRRYVSQI